MRRVVVTGMGVVCPIGNDSNTFTDGLLNARSGLDLYPAIAEVGLDALVVGQVTFDPTAHFSKMQIKQLDRVAQLSLMAARQAVRSADLEVPVGERDRAGVYWGTGLGGISTMEEGYIGLYRDKTGRTRPLSVVLGMTNASAAHISMEWSLHGPSLTISNACASSAMAIGEALRAIRSDQADIVIAGGAEAMLTPATLRAWQMMGTLARTDSTDPSRSCKPFAADRSGLVLAEGAGALILEEEMHARRRGAPILAVLSGYGCATDATHISKPDEHGQVLAMRAALKDAALNPSDIGYVNAHGTATEVGDVTETRALRTVFGQTPPPVSSTKAVHGHLIGAAGVIEFMAGLLALQQYALPPTAHLDQPDPCCDLDYIPGSARTVKKFDAFLSNSFAFGGNNAVLVAQRYA